MKTKLLSFAVAISLLMSCNKADTLQPQTIAVEPAPFKDANINVVKVQMEQKGTASVDFTFTTRYEVGIERIEVLHGTTAKNLCSFYEAALAGDSHSLKTYPISHNVASPVANYYMIRYFKLNGDWGYSPVYEIKMK